MPKITEFKACAECDSQEPLGTTPCADDDHLWICPDCGTVEGNTRQLFLNEETGEITADLDTANKWEAA